MGATPLLLESASWTGKPLSAGSPLPTLFEKLFQNKEGEMI